MQRERPRAPSIVPSLGGPGAAFESAGEADLQHVALPGDELVARDNQLVIMARGTPGATARVAIVAVRQTGC